MSNADVLLGREPLDTAVPRKRQRTAKAPAASERSIQIAIRDALRWHGIRSQHSANEGRRSAVMGRRLKQEGMRPGWPDLKIWKPGTPPLVGYLECKAAKGRISPAQEECIASLRADGFPVEVVRSVDEALAAIRAWGWTP
jgi:hypothetical protein